MLNLAENQKVCYPYSAYLHYPEQTGIDQNCGHDCNIKWQRQKEKLLKQIIELEKKLDAKQALELKIERMKELYK